MRTWCRVVERREEGGGNYTLFLDHAFPSKPGQFVMAWLPGESEKPFSLSYENAITAKNLGWYSERLLALREGDSLWVRGPYGKSFPVKEGAVLMGGGVGIAALLLLAKQAKNPKILLGGRTALDLIFRQEFETLGPVKVATEDGSLERRASSQTSFPRRGNITASAGRTR